MLNINGKKVKMPVRSALEDSLVVFIYTFLAMSIALGTPAIFNIETISGILLASAFAGIVEYCNARGIIIKQIYKGDKNA